MEGHPTYHVNMIKLKREIIWTGGLPHLPGVSHLHVNRPLVCVTGGIIHARKALKLMLRKRAENALSSAEASLCCREAGEKEKESARDYCYFIGIPSGSLCGGESGECERDTFFRRLSRGNGGFAPPKLARSQKQ